MTRALPMSQLWNSKRWTKSTAYVLLMVCLAKRSMSALPFSWGMWIWVAKVSPCARLGIQVGELLVNGSNHLCIEP